MPWTEGGRLEKRQASCRVPQSERGGVQTAIRFGRGNGQCRKGAGGGAVQQTELRWAQLTGGAGENSGWADCITSQLGINQLRG